MADPRIAMVLDDAYAALSRGPEYWTQRSFARDRTGAACPIGDPDGVCRCLLGQVYESIYDLKRRGELVFDQSDKCDAAVFEIKLIETVADRINIIGPSIYRKIVIFNDHATYAQVIDTLDQARTAARG